MKTPALSLTGITCTFVGRDGASQRYTAVRDVTLDVAPGEFVSVVGPLPMPKLMMVMLPAVGAVRHRLFTANHRDPLHFGKEIHIMIVRSFFFTN